MDAILDALWSRWEDYKASGSDEEVALGLATRDTFNHYGIYETYDALEEGRTQAASLYERDLFTQAMGHTQPTIEMMIEPESGW